MEYLPYVLLLVLIPLGAFKLTRHVGIGLVVACLMGCPILVARMIYLEEHAADSDFDIVFLVGMVIWCFVLCLVYCGWAATIYWIRRRTERRTKRS
jgi:hypothetical protein